MKIRTRLTLWYMSVSLAILLLFSLGTYVGMRQLLFHALDKEREFITQKILENYDPLTGSFNGLNTSAFSGHRLDEYYLILYDEQKQPVFNSPLADKMKVNFPLSEEDRGQTFTVSSFLFGGRQEIHYRAVSQKIYYHDHMVGWVNIALPLNDIEASMRHLLKILIAGILVAVVLIGFGSNQLTQKALRPVAAITRKAQRISSTNLNQRLKVFNRDDELGQLAMVLNDLLSRLQKAFDSQRQFMADAAHELKTPLAILRASWEEQLNSDAIPLETKQKLVRDVETISRLSHIINNLLLLSQSEAVHDNFDFAPMQLDELLREVVSDCQVLAEMKSQNLQIEELCPARVRGDKSRLYQLFFNLVDNAIKYTPETGRISVRLWREGQKAIAEVKDNGPGIPAEDLPHVFERFYRVKKDRSRKTGGSGLGLAICKLIAEAHNGEIEAESQPGDGTVFRVRLPLYFHEEGQEKTDVPQLEVRA